MRHPALALVEFDSVAAGIRAADAMVKRAPIALLKSGTIHPGHYLVLIGGSVGSVTESFQAGCDVHFIAYDREIHSLFRSYIPRQDFTGTYPDTDLQDFFTRIHPEGIKLIQFGTHSQGSSHGTFCIVGTRIGDTEHGHDRIPDILIKDSPLLKNNIDHERVVFIEEFNRLLCGQGLCQLHKTSDI